MIYSCIACCDKQQAQECHESFKNNLTPTQNKQGWKAILRTVESWDEVPVSFKIKLNFLMWISALSHVYFYRSNLLPQSEVVLSYGCPVDVVI